MIQIEELQRQERAARLEAEQANAIRGHQPYSGFHRKEKKGKSKQGNSFRGSEAQAPKDDGMSLG